VAPVALLATDAATFERLLGSAAAFFDEGRRGADAYEAAARARGGE